jgi:hypothetical protein
VDVYRFIEAEKAQQRNVKRACVLLEVSRAAYYAHRADSVSGRQRADDELTDRIRQATRHPRAATAPHASMPSFAAAAIGTPESGGKADAGRGPVRSPTAPVAGNHDPRSGGRRQGGSDPPRLHRQRRRGQHPLVRRHHLYPDLGRLAVSGHRDRHRLPPGGRVRPGRASATALVADALTNAVAARDPAPGVVFHVDRGCQCTSGDYAMLAGDLAVCLSRGRTGQCWDNTLAESFFASLKVECLDQQPWPTQAAARRATVEYIAWHNGTRLHSALGYMAPDEFETATRQEALTQVA